MILRSNAMRKGVSAAPQDRLPTRPLSGTAHVKDAEEIFEERI